MQTIMSQVIFIILFFFPLVFSKYNLKPPRSSSLKMLIEMTRHGARSPLYDNFTTSQWDLPPGELTPVGQRQHYLLGRELKKRYMTDRDYLNHSYSQEEVKVYSTDCIRTIQSAESQLLGLYYEEGRLFNQSKMIKKNVVPPINVENWEEIILDLKSFSLPFRFQPVPVKALPDKYNNILQPGSVCPKIKQIIKENFESQIHTNFEQNLHEMGFYKQFSEIFNVDASNFTVEQTQQYLDIITMNKFDNRELPENYTDSFDDMMNFAYSFRQFYLEVGNQSVLPFFVSSFFENLLEKFEEKVNGQETELKLEFFSAHDNNLIYVLRALDLMNYTDDYQEFMEPTKYFSYRNPPPASLLLFELHEMEGNYFVKVIFNDQVMELKGCQKFCSFPQFKLIVQQLILSDYDTQCLTSKPNDEEDLINKAFFLPKGVEHP